MKKLVSLAAVLMLVLCLATTAFAAEPIYDASVPTNVTLEAGATAEYEVRAFGMTMTITNAAKLTVTVNGEPCTADENGVITYAMPAGHPMMTPPAVISLTNTSDAAVESVMSFAYPVGNMANPAELKLYANTASIEAGNTQGYWFTWTAPAAGELIVTMPGGNWTYAINNMTSYVYGDTQWSDSEPVVDTAVVAVAKGDVLEIMVNTYDPNSWENPAGDIVIDVAFKCAAHEATHSEAHGASCHERGTVEYWYCANCDTYFLDEACTQITNALNIYTPATGSENVDHYEAVAPECHSRGNVEYWYCNDCDRYFLDEACTQLTNALSIWVGELGSENVQHIDAVAPKCHSIGNVEHWYCADCDGYFLDEACTQLTNSHSVILPATGSENVTHVEKVDPNCHVNGMQEHWYCEDCNGYFTDAETTHEAFYRDLIIPAEVTMDYYEAVEAGCHNNGNIEHWFCPECEGFYLDAFGIRPTNSLSVILPATGATTVTHYEAVEAYCHRNGMLEHWVCDDCGNYFTDAECTQQVMQPRYLIIPAEVSLEYHEKVNATCVENGMEEYWYCAECDCYFTDAEGIFNIASKRLVIEADGTDHVLEHHAAADPVCHKNGNVEYWYCAECDCYFIDVKGNLVNTNAKNVVILAEETLKHTAKVDATCTENGMQEYWYCENCDCYFTDAEGKFNIARLSLVIPAAGHNYVNGECTECGSDNPQTGDAGFMGAVATMLASAMSTVALVIKKKEF